MSRLLFYALGGGWGHQARCLNLLRRTKNSPDLKTRVLCPQRCLAKVSLESSARAISPCPSKPLAQWVLKELEDFQPDLFVIDSFPRGVLAELPTELGVPKLLVSRWMRPDFCTQDQVIQSYESFDEVFWVEDKPNPRLPGIEVGIVTDPRALFPREISRRELVAAQRPLVAVLGSGPLALQTQIKAETEQLAAVHNWDFRFLSHELQSSIPELGRYLRGFDLVVSAAGYNSYYEICRSGVPALFMPQARKYDDQFRRVEQGLQGGQNQHHRVYGGAELVESQLHTLLEIGLQPERHFQGGQRIVDDILARLSPARKVLS